MTLAELGRYFKSRKRIQEAQERKQASFDYILADAIGRSMARLYNKSNKYPPIEEIYSSLFDADEIRAERDRKRFVAGLQQYANSHNKNF